MLRSLITKKDNPFYSLQREMNSWFDRFGRDLDFSNNGLEGITPRVEVNETDKDYIVKAEVPGLHEEDIDISLQGNSLILKGERKAESEKEDKEYFFSEFSYGSFYRSIPFDEKINENTVNASYKNGIVTVELAKQEPGAQKSKKISLKH